MLCPAFEINELHAGQYGTDFANNLTEDFSKAMNPAPELHSPVRTLARYMRDNPLACDSAEGIRRWWLAEAHTITEDQLDKALNWMTQQKLISQTVAADGRVRFNRTASDAQLDAVFAVLTADGGKPAGTA